METKRARAAGDRSGLKRLPLARKTERPPPSGLRGTKRSSGDSTSQTTRSSPSGSRSASPTIPSPKSSQSCRALSRKAMTWSSGPCSPSRGRRGPSSSARAFRLSATETPPVEAPKAATPAESAVIRVEDIHKFYVLGETRVHALRGVSVEVHRGDFLAVMGASGSGKSTFMNILGCLDRPSAGRYLLEGTDVSTHDKRALALIR